MRWYALISLMSDGRVKFLIWFIIVAIIFAIILTLIEFRLKKKKRKQDVKIIDESGIEKMQRFLKYDKTPREKLDFVDKAAKEYLKEVYGTSLNSSYSSLIEELEKHRPVHKGTSSKKGVSAEVLFLSGNDEVTFCKAMFATYYSREELSNDRVVNLGKMLVNIKKDRKRAEEIFHIPSFKEEFGRLFHKTKQVVSKKIYEYMERKHTKKLRQQRIAKRRYELQILEEKAKMEHNRKIAIVRAQRIKDAKKAIVKLFHKISQVISNKIQKRKERIYRNKLRQQRIAKRRYELQILEEKAKMEHNRKIAIVRAQRIKDAKKAIVKLFHKISQVIIDKINEHREKKRVKKFRQQRIAKRRYELQILEEKAKMIRRQRIAIARAQRIKKTKKRVKELIHNWIKNLTGFGINQVRKVKYVITDIKRKRKIVLDRKKVMVAQARKIKIQTVQKVAKEENKLAREGTRTWKDKIIVGIKNIKRNLFRKNIKKIDQDFYRNIVSGISDSDKFQNGFGIEKEGIAERIVRNEKNRLKQVDIFSV